MNSSTSTNSKWDVLMHPFKTFDKKLSLLFLRIDSCTFRNNFWQLILSIGFVFLMTGLIFIRDFFFLDIPKITFLILLVLYLPLLKKEYIVYCFAFSIPFLHALPSNWVILVFLLLIFATNGFHLNIAQIVAPLIISLIELLLTFVAGSDFYFNVLEYFLFLTISSYLLFDRHIKLNIKLICYSFVVGVLLMCTLCATVQIKMIFETAQNVVDESGNHLYSFSELLFDPFVRLENISQFNEWTTNMKYPFYFVNPDITIGDDPNNMAYFLAIAAALLLYVTTNKKKSYIPSCVVLLVILFFGVFTKSRSFLITFPVVVVAWYVYSLICRRFKLKSLIYIFILIIIIAVLDLVFDYMFQINRAIFGRFNFAQTSDRWDLIIDYLSFMFTNWRIGLFGSGVLNITFVTGFETTAHTAFVQILFGYGVIGTILFITPIFFCIFYVRIYNRKAKIDLSSFIPLLSLLIFTLALQLLDPFLLMLPAVLCVMAINNFSTIEEKSLQKFTLLTDIKYLGNREEEEMHPSFENDNFNNYPMVELFAKKQKIVVKKASKKPQENAPKKTSKNHCQKLLSSIDSFYSKLNSLFDKIANTKIVKMISGPIPQLCFFYFFIIVIIFYVWFVGFYFYLDLKPFLIPVLILPLLFLNRKELLMAFFAFMPLANSLPQRSLILAIFVIYLVKSRFRFNFAQLAYSMTFIIFELLACCLFGFVNAVDSLSFLCIVSFLIYVLFDSTFKADISSYCMAFLTGFFIMAVFYIAPLFTYANYAIKNATQNNDYSLLTIICNNYARIGKYDGYLWYLNETFLPLTKLSPSQVPLATDDPNNIALFCILALVCIGFLLKKKWYIISICSILFVAVLFVGFMTKSRTFLISLVILLLLFYISAIVSKRINLLTTILIPVVLCALFGIYALIDRDFAFAKNFITRPDIEGDSFAKRFELIGDYLNMMIHSPQYLFTGTGLENETTAYAGFAFVKVDSVLPPHTSVIQVFVAYGILGFLPISFFFVYSIYVRIKSTKFDLFKFSPLIVIFIFSLSLQVLSPFELMFPFFAATLMINSCGYISTGDDKLSGLVYCLPVNKMVKVINEENETYTFIKQGEER